MTDDALLAKIRKLLALSQSPNEHEAVLAAARAQALLTEHGLSLGDLEETEHAHFDYLLSTGVWRYHLLGGIAQVNGCVVLLRQGNNQFVRIVGAASVLDGVKTLFETLQDLLAHLTEVEWRAHVLGSMDPWYGVYPSLLEPGYEPEWRESFLTGATVRVMERLFQARQETVEAHESDTSQALMRLDQQLIRSKDFVKANYATEAIDPPLPEGRLHRSGLRAGEAVGDTLPLTGQRRIKGK